MVDRARADPETSVRRDAILEAVAHAAERLLLSRDWLDAWIPDPDMRRQVLGESAAKLFNFAA